MEFYRYLIKGVVQGVGFRPYIYRLAKANNLRGYVCNLGSGVEVVVDDPGFDKKLKNIPPLSKIDEVKKARKVKRTYTEFTIKPSRKTPGGTQLPPDIFCCSDCVRELYDKGDRRHGYYFITCTNCGPRYSMITDYPYDRPNTSMDDYRMCGTCRKEYENPMDRRYHAQTIACKDCGPKLKLIKKGADKTGKTDADTIRSFADSIESGKIGSIKGVGGYHICCKAEDSTVKRLRRLVGRPYKPFALMVSSVKKAKEIVKVESREKELLESPQRPIVVLKKKAHGYLQVSELDSLGVMLPYTALHHMLFDILDEPLVMTSCNIPGEPVMTDRGLGEVVLTHEREIVNRCDDSVLKQVGEKTLFLRRSRGYTPLPVTLAKNMKEIISVGAEMNNVVAVSKGRNCILSQYIGDTSKAKTYDFLRQAVEKLTSLARLKPEAVASDLHPGYNSTAYARQLSKKIGVPLIKVQHHKAHVASVAAEHNLTDYAGIAVDGLGYGEDGSLWGGEVFTVNYPSDFTRVGCLQQQPQLGGDSATKNPKKMLFGILSGILEPKELEKLKIFKNKESNLYLSQLQQRFNTPMTSSAGRVLDATAALLGICEQRTYDGRPAMLLESHATKPYHLEPKISKAGDLEAVDTARLFRYLYENLGKDRGRLAATAQHYLAQGLFEIAERHAKGLPIVLSGGVAYNRMITDYMLERKVFVNEQVPAGDGGICFGQTHLANEMLSTR